MSAAESSHHIAVVDDDHSLNRSLVLHLEDRGFRVSAYTRGDEALAGLGAETPDLVLLDIRLGDMDGLDLLRSFREMSAFTPVVMITAFHDTALTLEATSIGAFDYLPKPLDLEKLDTVIDAGLARSRVLPRTAPGEQQDQPPEKRLVASSPAMLEVVKTMGKVASSCATILIEGESGTGKELVARTLHTYSGRPGPFLSVNCATLSSELLSSELFGHEKGAFTGADRRHHGTFERAQRGTVFLDEVAEMDLPIQAQLLRVLQEREIRRVGGSETFPIDVRVIAATNRNLRERVKSGHFREDLYYRLAVVPLRLPPLRERPEDLSLLIDHLLCTNTQGADGGPLGISPEAHTLLLSHSWAGNVRELENVITAAGLRCRGSVIVEEDIELPAPLPRSLEPGKGLRSLEEVERDHIEAILAHTGGNKAKAARIMGISRPTLDHKIKRYQLEVRRHVEEP